MEKLSLEHKLWGKIQFLPVEFHAHLKISTEDILYFGKKGILFFVFFFFPFFFNVNPSLIVFRLQL